MADAAPQTAATVLTGETPAAATPVAPVAPVPGVPPAAASVTPATVTPASNAPWYGDLTSSPELKTFAETKAFKDPAAAFAAYQNLERMVGVPADQLIRKPKDANDAEGLKAFRSALGVPDSADKYEIKPPDGQAGTEFSTWAANTFLDAGVPKDAATAIVAKWNEFAQSEMAKMDAQAQTEFANGMVQLKDSWGGAYNERVELAKRALRTFGKEIGINAIGDEGFKALEKGAGGGVQLIKLLAAVGARTSEDAFTGGSTPAFTMTAEQAKTKMAELQADKAWSSAYLSGDKNKQAEFQKLVNISLGTAT